MDKDKVLRDSIQRVQCVTLGCSKNRVDSEHLLRQLQAAGMQIAPEAENLYEGRVDAVILNTCGFIQDAKEESIEAILDAVQAKQEGCVRYVFVFGCLSQRYREDLPDLIAATESVGGVAEVVTDGEVVATVTAPRVVGDAPARIAVRTERVTGPVQLERWLAQW